MRKSLGLSVVLLCAPLSHAADLEAGRAKVAGVCAACHGAAGVSVSDAIPNLAGQRAAYIEAQLKALKAGTRKNPIMNAIAAQLAPDDMANVAAFFASLPGAPSGAKSELLPNVARSGVAFPEGYKGTFTKYHTVNSADTGQVTYFYANPAALAAAREGRPLPDGSVILGEIFTAKLDADRKPVADRDGNLVPDKLVAYSAMEREAGWGRDFPEMLRNQDWNYAVFTTAKQPRPGVNQAVCLACHKPQEKESYAFTMKELRVAARMNAGR